MSEPVISVRMSGNERGTDRHTALVEYLMRHPEEYDFAFGDVEVDLVFSIPTKFTEENPRWIKERAVELKMPADFAQSLQDGHLSQQRRQCPYPLQVAVLGSTGDVLRAFGKVGPNGPWTKKEIKSNFDFINRGVSKLRASGVDVAFGWSPLDWLVDWSMGFKAANLEAAEEMALEANMAQVVREARAYLEGDIHLPRAKCESVQEAMLMTLPTVGPKRAEDMITNGWRTILINTKYSRVMLNGPGDADLLCKTPGIGPKTAKKILEAMR